MFDTAILLVSADTGVPVRQAEIATGVMHEVVVGGVGAGAFDAALSRRGWVALHIGYEVRMYLAGHVADTARLPRAWSIYPAVSDDQVLIRKYLGRSSEPGEGHAMAAVSCDGVTRSTVLPLGIDDAAFVVGEVPSGIVTSAGICSWDGELAPLPCATHNDPALAYRPFAVMGGRVIAFANSVSAMTIDVVDGSIQALDLPTADRKVSKWSVRFEPARKYNSSGTWVHMHDNQGSIVASSEGHLRWLPGVGVPGGPRAHTVWMGDELLVLDNRTRTAVSYDPLLDAETFTTGMSFLGDSESSTFTPVVDVTAYQ